MSSYSSSSFRKQELEEEIEHITLHVRRDQFDKALERIEGLDDTELNQFDHSLYFKKRALWAICLNRSGKFPEAIEMSEPAFEWAVDTNQPAWAVLSAYPLADSKMKTGDLKGSMENIRQVEPLFDLIPTRGVPGANFFYFKEKRAELMNIRGIISWQFGDILASQQNFVTALGLYRELNQDKKIAMLTNNLGNIYTYQGDLDVALKHYEEALNIRRRIDDKSGVASTVGNLAEVNAFLGNLEEAHKHIMECKNIQEEIGNDRGLAHALYILITILIALDKLEEARKYQKQLEELDKRTDNKTITLQRDVGSALFLKNSDRLLDIFEGGLKLRDFMGDKIIDFHMFINASLNYAEVLLLELRLSGNEQVFDEVRAISQAIKYKAMQQNSTIVQIQTEFVLAQIALVDFQINEAQTILQGIIEKAESKNLNRFAVAASIELDRLMTNSSKWQELVDKQASIQERLELTNLEETLTNIIKKRDAQVPDIEPESPVMFIIMTDSGLAVYSKSFQEGMADEQIIAGFLSAIDQFGQQMFAGQGTGDTIERIKYGQFILLLKKFGTLMFCYVFRGQSYFAMKRFDTFVESLNENKIFSLQTAAKGGIFAMTSDEEEKINLVVERVFNKA